VHLMYVASHGPGISCAWHLMDLASHVRGISWTWHLMYVCGRQAMALSQPVATDTTMSAERVTGIEPAFSAWEADVLPLNYTRSALECTRFAEHCKSLLTSAFQSESVHVNRDLPERVVSFY
jgi:hypothetical protein